MPCDATVRRQVRQALKELEEVEGQLGDYDDYSSANPQAQEFQRRAHQALRLLQAWENDHPEG